MVKVRLRLGKTPATHANGLETGPFSHVNATLCPTFSLFHTSDLESMFSERYMFSVESMALGMLMTDEH